MKKSPFPGYEAIRRKGWLRAHKWLLLRRLSQLSIMAMFLVGPLFGVWVVTGNLSSSLTLETLPLTDPYLILQSLAAGYIPQGTALLGGLIVVLFYFVVGGRVFCSWVCPVNLLTDLAFWLRGQLGLRSASGLPRYTRYLLLLATLVIAFVSGGIAWELVNPVSMFHRGIIFGTGLAWLILLAIFLYDLFISRHGWCGHLCPVGAFYSLLGTHSLLRVRADARAQCDDCMDCYLVCPEQQVLRPALKGAGPVINSPNCTNCGRCIDVCSLDVFQFGIRFNRSESSRSSPNQAASPSSGV
ncbi:MAG: quinol dehydrogenase ferredoxin subunit NapH [Gammaproteobacteria bacterium]|nr:quinol dehydrogenase ferredoxin subunit NapH [Gammaproteobacteria bacterium]